MDKSVAKNFALMALDAGQKRSGFTIYDAKAVDSNLRWTVWCANKKTQGKLSKWFEAVSTLHAGDSPHLKCVATPSGLWVASTGDYGVSLLDYESAEDRRLGEILYLAYRFLDAIDHLTRSGIPLDSSMFEEVCIWQGDAGVPEIGFPALSPETRDSSGKVDTARLAGRFLYILLTGDLPPTEHAAVTQELDGERVGAFDSLLLDWVEEHTMATGLGDLAMQAYENEIDVSAFSKALYPHFQREVAALVSGTTQAESMQAQLKADAQTSRSRVVELEKNVTEQEQWLKRHAEEIKNAEQRVFAAQGRLHQLEILEQEISSQLGLESTTDFSLVQKEVAEEPIRNDPQPNPESSHLPLVHNDEDIELDPNQFWPDDPRKRSVRSASRPRTNVSKVDGDQVDTAPSKAPRLFPVFAGGSLLGGGVVALLIWLITYNSQPVNKEVAAVLDVGVEAAQKNMGTMRGAPMNPAGGMVPVESKSSITPDSFTVVSKPSDELELPLDAGVLEVDAVSSNPKADAMIEPATPLKVALVTVPDEMIKMVGGQLRRGLDQSQANRLSDMCFRVFGVSARRCKGINEEITKEGVVDLIEPFAIDKTEVEFTAYEECVQTKICSAPMHEWNKKNYPVTGISAKSADVYCRWKKKRLPTEREWVFAVRRAQDNRVYPWGDRAPNRGQANLGAWANKPSTDSADGYRYVAPVTSFQSGSNGAGVINLVGNVQEFVVLDKELAYAAKGGGYLSLGFEGRVTAKRKVSPNQTATDLGFRCARSL